MEGVFGVLGFPRLLLMPSVSRPLSGRKTGPRVSKTFRIHEDVAHEDSGDKSRAKFGQYAPPISFSSSRKQSGIARGFLDAPEKRMSNREIEAHLCKAPRRRTIYIPSEDTTIVTIHPGAAGPARQFSNLKFMRESNNIISSIVTSDGNSSGNRSGPKVLRAAPRRISLLPVQSDFLNTTTIAIQYGSGPGKENVPPGMLESAENSGKITHLSSKRTFIGHRWTSDQSSRSEASACSPHLQAKTSPRTATLNRPPMRRRSHALIKNPGFPNNIGTIQVPVNARASEDSVIGSNARLGLSSNANSPSLIPARGAEMINDLCQPDLYRPELFEDDDWLGRQESMIVHLLNQNFKVSPRKHRVDAFDTEIPIRDLFDHYQSDESVLLYRRIQASLAYGALSLPRDMMSLCPRFQNDLGLRQKFMDLWLDSYNPEALSLALKVIDGCKMESYIYRSTQLQSSVGRDMKASKNKVQTLLRFILLNEKHCNTSGSMRTTSEESQSLPAWQRTFLKSLMVLLLLDKMKTATLFSGLLFQSTSAFKTSKAILGALGRLLLPSLGDIHRVLGHLGFEVTYRQVPLDEYVYRVENLSTDFRDGIRLMRLVGGNRSSELKYPCTGRAQKLHNVRLSLDTPSSNEGFDDLFQTIGSEDIVDGHREKTIALLTSILGQRSLTRVIDPKDLAAEMQRLSGRYCRSNYGGNRSRNLETLIQAWVTTVMSVGGIKTSNSFQHITDSRLVRALVCVYAHCLPTAFSARTKISNTVSPTSVFLDALDIPKIFVDFLIPASGRPRILPPSFRLPLLGFLCSRVLAVTKQGRAASIIQSTWRRITQRKEDRNMAVRGRLACACKDVVMAKTRLEKAVLSIQSAWRDYLRRRQQGSDERRRINEDVWTGAADQDGESDIWLV